MTKDLCFTGTAAFLILPSPCFKGLHFDLQPGAQSFAMSIVAFLVQEDSYWVRLVFVLGCWTSHTTSPRWLEPPGLLVLCGKRTDISWWKAMTKTCQNVILKKPKGHYLLYLQCNLASADQTLWPSQACWIGTSAIALLIFTFYCHWLLIGSHSV